MKVHLNLQPAPNRTSGIGVYAHEIATRLMLRPDLELRGGFSSLRTRSVPLFDTYDFPVHLSRIPERLLYPARRSPSLPMSYNTIMRDASEAFLFFSNRLPVARIAGTVIVVVHDLIPLRIPLELPGLVDRYRRQLEEIHRRADVIVTVSQSSRNDIAHELDMEPERIAIAANGVRFEDLNPPVDREARASVRARYALPDRYILYFGGTRPYKNVARIIEAYSLLNPAARQRVKLVITRRDADLQEQSRRLGVQDSVVFTRPVSDDDKAAVYQMADTTVLVSLYEGFGIPVIEAMAAGTPVIASNVSSLPEACGGAGLLVDPLDTRALAEALDRVLDDADLRRSMIASGLANARRFTWDASADTFHRLLTPPARPDSPERVSAPFALS